MSWNNVTAAPQHSTTSAVSERSTASVERDGPGGRSPTGIGTVTRTSASGAGRPRGIAMR